MSLTGVIASFAEGTFAVTRTAAGSYTTGRYTPGADSSFTIDATIQPVTGRELQALPEAHHATEVRVIYTTTELRTRTPTTEPDVVAISGESWEVFKVETWNAFGATHYRAFVSRVDTP